MPIRCPNGASGKVEETTINDAPAWLCLRCGARQPLGMDERKAEIIRKWEGGRLDDSNNK